MASILLAFSLMIGELLIDFANAFICSMTHGFMGIYGLVTQYSIAERALILQRTLVGKILTVSRQAVTSIPLAPAYAKLCCFSTNCYSVEAITEALEHLQTIRECHIGC